MEEAQATGASLALRARRSVWDRSAWVSPVKIAGAYLIFGLLWIWLSDYALDSLGLRGPLGFWAAAGKGTLFVLLSSSFIFILSRREVGALSRATNLLRAVTEGTGDAIFVKDQEGTYVFANHATAVSLGRPLSQVLGRSDHDLFDALTAEQVRATDARVLRRGIGEIEEQTVVIAGHERTFLATKSAFRDARGAITGVIGVAHDITERKRAESATRELNSQLEERVRRRTAELEAANQELEAFSYSVSHDLRAPLRAVNGFARILLDEHASSLSADARDHLGEILLNARRMGALVDDLLSFSRMGRKQVNRREVDTNELVASCLAEVLDGAAGRRIETSVANLPASHADPALLRQVWINLLSNSVKYTRERNPAVIEIGAEKNERGEVVFHVRDNGVGFDMQYADKLFGVFQRLHHSDEYEGTGIGLALVQRILHRHGGRAWADAAPERGATFFFTLGDNTPSPGGSTIHAHP